MLLVWGVQGEGYIICPIKPETTDCCIVWSCGGADIKLWPGPVAFECTSVLVHSNATGPPILLCRCSFWQVVTWQNLPFWHWQHQKQHMSQEKTFRKKKKQSCFKVNYQALSTTTTTNISKGLVFTTYKNVSSHIWMEGRRLVIVCTRLKKVIDKQNVPTTQTSISMSQDNTEPEATTHHRHLKAVLYQRILNSFINKTPTFVQHFGRAILFY